jgi:hypothetical protein
MRACEGCRRRKIKCDAATTNTWPCSACIRLKLHCVRPNGFDSSTDSQSYEAPQQEYEAPQATESFRQQLPLQESQLLAHAPKPGSLYASQSSYQDASGLYPQVQYTGSQAVPHSLQQYASVHQPVGVVDQQYTAQTNFPTPPLQNAPQPDSPADTYSSSDYAQQDLADLLGSLKVNEAGTGRGTVALARFTFLTRVHSALSEQ